MTTNYLDRLDLALMRPGRVDIAQYIGAATYSQAKRLFRQFYPELKEQPDTRLPSQFATTITAER